ncbi:MAG: DUF3429 domain-containing protein [Roseateles depolymerans]|uniref:DUF3429 domain-containing protein n=1 Tax=Roseateles depolymerans TaxID=76731 RepID=A0A2W5F463_9BURK|nr:MAG: DUF3429 domain-containing protein [Roseateles depolymerans]
MTTDHRLLAERLGYAGLLPFVLGCALVWLLGGYSPEQHAFVVDGLSRYAAVVIAFLGGIHWGVGFVRGTPSRASLIWGVTAAFLGWVAALTPAYAGLALHGAVLIACYVMDRRLYPALGISNWLTLRFRLSAVAALSCFLAAAGS